MTKPKISQANIRTIEVDFDRHELRQLLLSRACQMAGVENLTLDGHGNVKGGFSVKIDFKDITEGSPPYKLGTSAKVTIVEDKFYVAEEVSHDR